MKAEAERDLRASAHGRADPVTQSSVTGWFLAEPGAILRAVIDGAPAGEAVLLRGTPRQDVPAGAKGFTYAIPRRFHDGESHVLSLSIGDGGIIMFTAPSGKTSAELRFRFAAPEALPAPDPLAQDAPAPATGSPEPLAQTAPVRGAVEAVEGVEVSGWAVRGNGAENCLIELRDAGTGRLLASGRASRRHEAMAKFSLGFGNFGFRLSLAGALQGVARVAVLADGVEIAGSPLPVGPAIVDGSVTIVRGVIEGRVSARADDVAPPLVEIISHDGLHIARIQSASDPDGSGSARFQYDIEPRWLGHGELGMRFLANGVEFCRAICPLRLKGYLDALGMDSCSGWLFSPDLPSTALEIEVWRDGVVVGSGVADLPREDLSARFPDNWRSGFSIALTPRPDCAPEEHAAGGVFSLRLKGSNLELLGGPHLVVPRHTIVAAAEEMSSRTRAGGASLAEGLVSRLAIAEFIDRHRSGAPYVRFAGACAETAKPATGTLTVVVPVYRDVSVTRDCLESVLRHRRQGDLLLVIDDASPEPGMPAMLRSFERQPDVFVVRNEENLGFVQSCNRAFGLCGRGDVVLLNSDTRVFSGAFGELQAVAYSDPGIGTATAMSNNATIFSYPHPDSTRLALEDADWEALAHELLATNRGMALDVPTGHGFCMLIKRAVLDTVGQFDERFGRGYGEENDFCLRAAALGWRHVAAAAVLVEHRESVSFGAEKERLRRDNLRQLGEMYPEYTPLVIDHERREGLRAARWPLDRFRLRASRHHGGFTLLIDNALSGGTKTAIADIADAIELESSRVLRLTAEHNGMLRLEAKSPLLRAVFAPHELAPLFEMLDAAGVAEVQVHQLLGYEAAFLTRLTDWLTHRHSVFFVHDYYFACPRVTLLDACESFCGMPDAASCARCVAIGGPHPASRLTALDPSAHRAVFGALLEACSRIVAPSREAAKYVEAMYTGLTVTVMPHPQTGRSFPDTIRPGSADEIVMLGAIGPHKGSRILLDVARRARIRHPELTFRVIGFTDIDTQLKALGNVTVTGPFKQSELASLLSASEGRIALFLHGWPETFSYTLTEAVAAGFLPVVPAIGAPAERVAEAGFGVVYDFPFDAERVLATLAAIRGLIEAGDIDGFGNPKSFDLRSHLIKLAKTTLSSGNRHPAGRAPKGTGKGATKGRKPRAERGVAPELRVAARAEA